MKNQKYYSVLLTLVVFLALSVSAGAASNTVMFSVTDSATGQPINGASVFVKDNNTQMIVKYGLTTNGYVTFYNLSTSNYTAFANATGYGTSTISLIINEAVSSYSFSIPLVAIAGCVRANPTVSITPSIQSVYAGGKATFNVSITNNDNSACGTSVFYRWGISNISEGVYTSDDYSGRPLPAITHGGSLKFQMYVITQYGTPAGTYYAGVLVENTNVTTPLYSSNSTANLMLLSPVSTPNCMNFYYNQGRFDYATSKEICANETSFDWKSRGWPEHPSGKRGDETIERWKIRFVGISSATNATLPNAEPAEVIASVPAFPETTNATISSGLSSGNATNPPSSLTINVCDGCLQNSKCYQTGYRVGGEYCSGLTGNFTKQSIADSVCDNNFECESNICVSGKCVSGGLLEAILGWFKRLFGIA